MIRDFFFRTSIPAVLALAATLGVSPGQELGSAEPQGPISFEHRFGGDAPGEPGFLVSFHRQGAGVREVKLLDQRAGDSAPDPDEPYTLVFEELVDPADPGRGSYPWLQLREETLGEYFPELAARGGLARATWEVAEQNDQRVRFVLDAGGGITVEKSYVFEPGYRDLIVELALKADGSRQAQDVAARWRFQLDGFGLIAPRSDNVLGGSAAMAVGSVVGADGSANLATEKAPGERLAETVELATRPQGGRIDYAGSTNRFFGGFLYPEPGDEPSAEALVRVTMDSAPSREQLDMPVHAVPVAKFQLSLAVPAPGSESRVRFRIYLGPKSFTAFDEHPEYERFDPVLEAALDPQCCSIPGSRTLAIFLLWLLRTLQSVVGNWGLAIVCLTIIVRGALVPLNFRMQKSMRAYGAKMAKLKPKLDALQKKYANDQKQLQQEMVAFQREHKMFPPLGGCLPMFITIPIFIGLFTALRVSYDLRLEPFMLWIDDLSRPDRLFETGLSFLPYFNLMPIIMVVLWWWLQHGTPLPKDPQQRQVMKIMRFMPLMFGVMLYQYASGLMVYMITSSVFGLVEQRVTRRILGPVDPDAAGVGATPML